VDILDLLIIFFVALLGGAFGSLIGGTSILTIPVLILLGLPPHTAIGTDRFGIIGIGLAGWYKFQKKKLINYRIAWIIAIPIFFGSMIGSHIVLQIDEGILKKIIVGANIIMTVFILMNPKVGVEKRATGIKRREYIIGILLCFVVGVYGGFYGAVSGTFILYILVLWFKQTFIQSAANRMMGSVFMTVTASTIFIMNHAVDFYFGTTMFIGCLLGSYAGVHYMERIGDVWVKRIFTLFMIIVIGKMVLGT
jgi:uncharacterized membrane protein YfcA